MSCALSVCTVRSPILATAFLAVVGIAPVGCSKNVESETYSTYGSFQELVDATDAIYIKPVRVTQPGTADHGFFSYNCQHRELLQFDPSGRYMAVLQVPFEGRDIRPDDKGIIGIVDLESDYA